MHCTDLLRHWIQPLAWLALAIVSSVGMSMSTHAHTAPKTTSSARRSVHTTSEEPQVTAEDLAQKELVTQIRIVGNDTIPSEQISGQLSTRVGRPFDRTIVQQDVRRLATLGWFVDVKSLSEEGPGGRIIIFQVVERPTTRYITYIGNETIADKNLAKQTELKSGGSVDPYAVREGQRKIKEHYQDRGYNNVQVTILEGNQATDKGIVYLINEGNSQRFISLDIIGNDFVSDGRLKNLVKSKPPKFFVLKGYVNHEQLDKDVDQLTAYYRSFGFFQAKVGRKLDFDVEGKWVRLTFVVHEGPRYQVRNVKFLGNTKFEPTGMQQAAKLTAGQPFEQAKMQTDALWLKELYGSKGYVFADVRPETVFLEEPGEIDLIYHIDEGEQFRVGRILVHIGGDNPHTRIQTALNRMTLRPGDIMDIRELKASERRLLASGLFHSDAATNVRPKITYRIPDGTEDYFASRPTARRKKSRAPPSPGPSSRMRRGGMRGQSPDDLGPLVLPPPVQYGNLHQVQKPRNTASVRNAPSTQATDIHIECLNQEHYQHWLQTEEKRLTPPSEEHVPPRDAKVIIRGQSPAAQPQRTTPEGHWWARRSRQAQYPPQVQQAQPRQPSYAWQPTRPGENPYQTIRGQNPNPSPDPAYVNLPVSGGASPYGGKLVGATGPSSVPATAGSGVQPVQYSENIAPPAGSAGAIPGFLGNPVQGYQAFPDGHFGLPGQPYPMQTVDIIFEGQETQTGRLMMGVGINSNAGLVGNIVLDERNFNWRRPPRSFEDFRNGVAWRGDAQRFRLEASPGSLVNRYLFSFQEPYLFDRPISLGLSGSYYDRRYRDWDEGRLGGRVSVGHQWVEHDLSVNLSYRGESVDISRISTPGQADLDEALGENSLHGFKVTLINDTRDSAFLPTQGHYLEVSGEQVIGSFDYPRVKADYRRYWLMRERPDHSGRHVLSAATNIGYTGTRTPIYEHFFAGGFSTMRGFDFRGASPVDMGAEVGGEFQWLNSVQYLFPVTADEMLHGVVFCDFGTVESEVTIKDFRVSPGFGLRVTIPAMGSAPIALDFAFPVASAAFDDEQVFSFSMGFSR